MRILVLEDEDSIRRMISALVQARGFEVIAVANGVKAVDEALTRSPDVAILDLMVPGAFDGFEVCRRLRQNPQTSKIPIIIISALDDPESRKKATEAGATTYFVKPFSAIALLKELEAVKAGKPSPSQMNLKAVKG
jgi:DNA-binding response OmpR family regulator